MLLPSASIVLYDIKFGFGLGFVVCFIVCEVEFYKGCVQARTEGCGLGLERWF